MEFLQDEYETPSTVFAPHIKFLVWNGIFKSLILVPKQCLLLLSTKTGLQSIFQCNLSLFRSHPKMEPPLELAKVELQGK